MKNKIFAVLAVALLAVFSGCHRFDYPEILDCDALTADSTMTLEEAEKIVKSTLAAPPTGRRPKYIGAQFIGNNVTSIRVRDHKNNGYCLVEVMKIDRPFIKFYTTDRKTAEKFAKAVWRMKKEYSQNSVY